MKKDFGQALYWNYCEYANTNKINNLNKKTLFLYGNQDNMQNQKIIKEFTCMFNYEINIL